MRKQLLTTLLAAALLLGFGMQASAEGPAGYDTKLVIIHTNDVHGAVNNLGYVTAVAAAHRAAGDQVLVVDAGDVLFGQSINVLYPDGSKVMELMNAVGYDAFVPGNADERVTAKALKKLAGSVQFPFLAANYADLKGKQIFKPYKIFQKGNIKVGVFCLAAIIPETSEAAFSSKTTDTIAAAKGCVAKLRAAGCNLVVAVTHLGIGDIYDPSSVAVAKAVPGIDIIIDGHSHTVLKEGQMEGGALIAQTGTELANIGVVEVYLKKGVIMDRKASLLSREEYTAAYKPDAKVQAQVDAANAEIKKATSRVIGSTANALDGERASVRAAETNLGDLVCDSFLWKAGDADIALFPGFAIRASIPAGDINMDSLMKALPMGEEVVTAKVTGEQILKFLEMSVTDYPKLSPSFLQCAGFKYVFNPDAAAGSRIVSAILDNGKPIDPKAIYVLVAPSVLLQNFFGIPGGFLKTFNAPYSVLSDYIAAKNPATPAAPAGRVTTGK
jgi:5'-nucleotidase / UDP-sugar diphosphatase